MEETRGDFRADLYYRLCGFQIDIPPLRNRIEDVDYLARHFLDQDSASQGGNALGISSGALRALKSYRWPGNVRELQHAIKTAAALAEGSNIEVADLPNAVTKFPSGQMKPIEGSESEPGGDTERARLLDSLQATAYAGSGRWNLAAAARELGMNRKTLEYQVRKVHNLEQK